MGLPVYQELRVCLVAAFVENTGFLEWAALATTFLVVIILRTYVYQYCLAACFAPIRGCWDHLSYHLIDSLADGALVPTAKCLYIG